MSDNRRSATKGGRMTGDVVVHRPVQEVFDFAADLRNEPLFNPRMRWAEKVSPGAIGVGTQFRQRMRMPGRGARVACEVIEYEPPSKLAVRSHLTWMETEGGLTFESVPDGTRVSWNWDVRWRGSMRMLGPILLAIGRRQERATWLGLKDYLERRASPQDEATGVPPRQRTRPKE